MFVSKKKYLALQKEFQDWKEGRKKTLFEQAGIYPPETIATLTEENRILCNTNRELFDELQKYQTLYADELQKRVFLADKLKSMEGALDRE